jgi:ribose transport system permease protein
MSTLNKTFNTVKKSTRDYMIMVAILLLAIVTAIVEPKFLSTQNFTNIMSQIGALSFVAMGMTFAIMCGFIDLSVVGIINISAVVMITLMQPLGQIPAMLIGLGLGAVLGFINSMLILSAGAMTLFDALFITFGMSTVYSAIALIVAGGLTQQLTWITRDTSIIRGYGAINIGPFPIPILVFVIFLVILQIFLSKTYSGRSIMLSGGNKTAARLAGLPVKQTIMKIFTLTGFMAAMGAMVMFARVTTVSPKIGLGFEMDAILAVVIGGTTLKGGNGSLVRTFFGVLLVTLLGNCMNLMGISTHIQAIMRGAVFILAIWLDNAKEKSGVIE